MLVRVSFSLSVGVYVALCLMALVATLLLPYETKGRPMQVSVAVDGFYRDETISSRETLRFSGNKIHCPPRDQSLSDLFYSKTNGPNRWKTNTHSIATAANISRATVNCLPFDVIVFAMLPAHGNLGSTRQFCVTWKTKTSVSRKFVFFVVFLFQET